MKRYTAKYQSKAAYTADGTFIRPHIWTAELTWADGSAATTEAGGGYGAPTDAISIEWKATDISDAVCGSALTLVLESMTDGQWRQLADTEAQVRLYRDGELYWRGVLDNGQYSEPYDRAAHYDVTLVFSDLGSLKRRKFDLKPDRIYKLSDLLSAALGLLGYAGAAIMGKFSIHNAIGQGYGSGQYLTLGDIGVYGGNFYDEDGEPLKWHDVLEGILKPLNLRLVQVPGGDFCVYDIYNIRGTAERETVWAATGQTLSAADRYDTVKLTYSPYGTANAVDAAIDRDRVRFPVPFTQTYYQNVASKVASFALTFGTATRGSDFIVDSPDYAVTGVFKRLFDGDDTAALILVRPGGTTVQPLQSTGLLIPRGSTMPLWHIEPVRINAGALYLRVQLEMFIDGRYNPYTEEGYDNADNKGLAEVRLATVPCRIYVVSDTGATYYYNNIAGEWSTAPAWCYLAYYPWDKKSGGSVKGWVTNKDFCHSGAGAVEKRGNGEFIAHAPGGMLHIEFCRNGIGLYDKFDTVSDNLIRNDGNTYRDIRWLMFRSLKVDVCDTYGNALEAEDIVYTADIADGDRGDCSIDTICGSAGSTLPTARGIYYLNPDAPYPLRRYGIPGLGGIAEAVRLTLAAAQYGQQRWKLDGIIRADDPWGNPFDPTRIYADPGMPGSVFLPTAAVLDCLAGTVDAELTELKPLIYDNTSIAEQD